METITMSVTEQRRALVLTRVVGGDLSPGDAAASLGCSGRQLWRLLRRFRASGPAGLVHGNRGRASERRVGGDIRDRVVALARGRYAGANDTHLSELLGEREGIQLSRSSVRRILRSEGIASPRRRRAPRHRSRRERMAAEGLLLQLDGSRHHWLGPDLPKLTLLGAIDDATSTVPAATFRDQEDAAGYLEIMRTVALGPGLPGAIYRDRHSAFEPSAPRRAGTQAEERALSQVGRALTEIGVVSIAAGSPQAKGRIERLWGTLQDRLLTELRLAGANDRTAANAVLAGFLPDFNRRFGVPAANPVPAWRPWPDGLDPDRVFAFKYRLKVAKDDTVCVAGQSIQLPAAPRRFAYAGKMVEVHLRLDGSVAVFDGERELVTAKAPPDAHNLRALQGNRPEPSLVPAAAYVPYVPPVEHPWKRMTAVRRDKTRALTDSLSS
jgi:transposase